MSVLLIADAMFVGGSITKHRIEKRYQQLLAERDLRLTEASRIAVMTTKEVKAGEAFSAENTEKRLVLSEQAAECLLTDAVGKIATTDLAQGMLLTTAVCEENVVQKTERVCIYDDILYAEEFEEHAVVDVRIRYPNGENYCVLQKKRLLKDMSADSCKFTLTEEEQLLMSGARYDAEVYDGTVLYVVRFLEERLQGENNRTYIPPEQIIEQMAKIKSGRLEGAELYEERMMLEKRLKENKEKREETGY